MRCIFTEWQRTNSRERYYIGDFTACEIVVTSMGRTRLKALLGQLFGLWTWISWNYSLDVVTLAIYIHFADSYLALDDATLFVLRIILDVLYKMV